MSNKIFVITGPSAVGKTTIAKTIFERFPKLKSAITYTTRQKRDWSQEDKLIHYVSHDKFKELIDADQLIEWAEVYGEFYGTGKKELLEILENHSVLLNIDVQGAQNIKQQFPESIVFFIQPDSLETLKARIDERPIEQSVKDKRWQAAKIEMAKSTEFDYQITNVDGQLEKALAQISEIIRKNIS